MTRAMSARTFALTSYSNDAFEAFKINEDRLIDLEKSDLKKRSVPTILVKNIHDKEYTEGKNRPQVPHDHISNEKHTHYCRSFGGNMITSSISYHPRQKKLGIYGITNRIQFLRNNLPSSSVRPNYPASYYGPGGEGRPYALGLTEAGCPSSNQRSLQVSSTFGTEKILNRACIPTQLPSKKEITTFQPNDSPTDFTGSMYQVLNIKQSILPALPTNFTTQANTTARVTRFSANKEWGRATNTLTQPCPDMHHYIGEKVCFYFTFRSASLDLGTFNPNNASIESIETIDDADKT